MIKVSKLNEVELIVNRLVYGMLDNTVEEVIEKYEDMVDENKLKEIIKYNLKLMIDSFD